LALWQAWRTGGFRDPRLRFLLCWAAAPLVAFTPAEWKLRYYLLPSLPALALVTAPAVLRLAAEPARRLSTRGLAVLAATATGLVALAFAARSLPLSPSDRSTLDALLRIVPGGRSFCRARRWWGASRHCGISSGQASSASRRCRRRAGWETSRVAGSCCSRSRRVEQPPSGARARPRAPRNARRVGREVVLRGERPPLTCLGARPLLARSAR